MPTFPNRRPGDNIGGYVLGRHLGEGNSGQVFAVRDSDPDKKYAAKLLNKDALLAKNYPTRSVSSTSHLIIKNIYSHDALTYQYHDHID
jgi:serine/threonine protein kinase